MRPMSFGLTTSGREKTKGKLRLLLAHLQPTHLYEILGDLRGPLLAFVNCKIWPMYKLSVDLVNKLSEKRMYMILDLLVLVLLSSCWRV